ncbi:hypothetical protein CBS101457_005669 [Exobasidium rhododendri]|nr:hypothetical protein CBS101457_005669 [Exobasidium rhododendri]
MSVLHNPHPSILAVDASTFDYKSYKFPDIKVELLESEAIMILTLDRPARHNAFTNDMCHSMVFALELADMDDRVKVVIMTGSGKSFCAGADLGGSGFGAAHDQPLRYHRDGGGQASGAVLRCRKLVIAAVNGNAVGIGITMVLPADIRIVSESAKLAMPFVKRGITLEAMSGYILPRLVGHSNALEISMTGDVYLPSSKCFSPMFREIVPSEEVFPLALKLAKRLAKENSSVSMALNKALVWRAPSEGGPEATHLIDSMCIRATSAGKDAKEGVESFLQKRAANFTGTLKELDWFGFYPWWNQVDISGTKLRGQNVPSKL